MSILDRAFNDWYASDDDSIWNDEIGEAESFSTLDLIANGELVSDDAIDMTIWRSLHVEAEDIES